MVILEVIWEVVLIILMIYCFFGVGGGGRGDYFCHFGGFRDITITRDFLKVL